MYICFKIVVTSKIIPISYILTVLSSPRSRVRRNEWQNTDGNKLRVIKNSISVWPSSQQRVRKDEVVLARLRIGHTLLTHGYLMEGGRMPYCGDCLVPLSIKHVLVECPSYRDERCRTTLHYRLFKTRTRLYL